MWQCDNKYKDMDHKYANAICPLEIFCVKLKREQCDI